MFCFCFSALLKYLQRQFLCASLTDTFLLATALTCAGGPTWDTMVPYPVDICSLLGG